MGAEEAPEEEPGEEIIKKVVKIAREEDWRTNQNLFKRKENLLFYFRSLCPLFLKILNLKKIW